MSHACEKKSERMQGQIEVSIPCTNPIPRAVRRFFFLDVEQSTVLRDWSVTFHHCVQRTTVIYFCYSLILLEQKETYLSQVLQNPERSTRPQTNYWRERQNYRRMCSSIFSWNFFPFLFFLTRMKETSTRYHSFSRPGGASFPRYIIVLLSRSRDNFAASKEEEKRN